MPNDAPQSGGAGKCLVNAEVVTLIGRVSAFYDVPCGHGELLNKLERSMNQRAMCKLHARCRIL